MNLKNARWLWLAAVIVLLAGIFQLAPAQAEKEKPVQKWEYKLLQIDSSVEKTMNDAGEQGWELVSVGDRNGTSVAFHFKRPK